MSSKINVNNFKAGGPEIEFVTDELSCSQKSALANSKNLDVLCIKCGKKFVAKLGKNICPHCGHEQEIVLN